MLNINLVTPPAVEPVSLQQAKDHLRVSFSDDDALISGLITAARQWAETYTRRAFFTQTWQLNLDNFPWWEGDGTIPSRDRHSWPMYSAYWNSLAIRLPMPQAIEVSSITYLDLTNTQQALSASQYHLDNTSEPGRIVPQAGLTWPSTQLYLPGSVAITYTCGTYGDGSDVNNIPQTLVAAILLMVGHFYNHRGDDSSQIMPPPAVNMLLDTVRCTNFSFGNR